MPRESSVRKQEITGYIRSDGDIQDGDVEKEDEEEEIQPEFLDTKEMDCVSSGGKMFKFSVPPSKEGKAKILINKQTNFQTVNPLSPIYSLSNCSKK